MSFIDTTSTQSTQAHSPDSSSARKHDKAFSVIIQNTQQNELSGSMMDQDPTQSENANINIRKLSQSLIRECRSQSNSNIIQVCLPPNLQFITEKEFLLEKKCIVCKINFGKLKDREHHCRLCAHATCNNCSQNRIDDKRICDICLLKVKNFRTEKRKKKIISLIKEFVGVLAANIKKGQQEIADLKQKDRTNQPEVSEIKLMKQSSDNFQTQFSEKQKEMEKSTKKLQDLKEEFQNKQNKVRELQEKYDKLLAKDETITHSLQVKEQNLQNKQYQYQSMKHQKIQIESSSAFKKLPLYQEAIKYNPENISQTLIILDNNAQKAQSEQQIQQRRLSHSNSKKQSKSLKTNIKKDQLQKSQSTTQSEFLSETENQQFKNHNIHKYLSQDSNFNNKNQFQNEKITDEDFLEEKDSKPCQSCSIF